MPSKKADVTHGLPLRPKPSISSSNLPPHSSSVPSTPHQHARKFSFESRDHSPNANQSHSPRSAYSETNSAVPSLRPLPSRHGGCKYETALKFSRRRIPYSIGIDPLEKTDLKTIKNKLSEDDERKLTTDMRELYDRLQPTEAVEAKRQKLVQKLEKLLNTTWPGHDIRVHLFGSSGNLLCSDDSDVDICIKTAWKELEGVCMLADLLAKHGMEKVVCVSSAKVPIVKIWDPELELSCDMNVNNTLALENTRMIKTYVELDERVRPLAMIVKYWTRRRVVNDAAFGGTLSSYTWICMIIAFLQLRQPPVLPALHQRPHQKVTRKTGEIAAFADDVDKLRGFGSKNKSTLGELLFQFFRFYAHEFDYSMYVLSVRSGKTITKTEKKWQFAQNNQLCVEEPFNTMRNLGNTADDTAFRGVHLELRRAFDLIAQGKLDDCCEQYIFPKEEERIFQKQPPVSRPVPVRSASQHQNNRGGRGGAFRGGNRHSGQNRNNTGNNNSNNRRASSVATYDNNANAMYAPYAMPYGPQDAAAMYMPSSSDVVAQTLSALQFQENNLRFLQYTQSQHFAQQQALHNANMQGNVPQSQSSTERSRTNSFDTPMSAPLRPEMRPDMYYYPVHMQQAQAYYAQQGVFPTYPPTTSNNQTAEYRRGSQRSTASDTASLSGSTLRSQSQPASRPVNGMPKAQSFATTGQVPNGFASIPARHINGIPIPSFIPDEGNDYEQEDSLTSSPPQEERSNGYYTSPSSPQRVTNASTNGMPAFGDIGPQASAPSRRLSSDQFPQSVLDRIQHKSRSPSPLGHNRAFSVGRSSVPAPVVVTSSPGAPARETAPVVVNGSVSKPPNGSIPRQAWRGESTTTEYAGHEGMLYINQYSSSSSSGMSSSPEQSPVSQKTNSPVVVNGSTNSPALGNPQSSGGPHFTIDAVNVNPTGLVNTIIFPTTNGSLGNKEVAPMSPAAPPPQRVPRGLQSALIAQLDLATENRIQANELQHLSPVYEANTPSPNVTRKLELPLNQNSTFASTAGYSNQFEAKSDTAKGKQKTPAEASLHKFDVPTHSNTRVNGIQKENGHVRGAKSESDNAGTIGTWQRAQRGRKKATEPNGRSGVSSQREQPPKDESERKGG
ncbi:Uu.00g117830.m01.CDS01 [Anthostomella pinea]|uniref:polynucleotide adenylyltransferase n=1 Tax=Anthostomella pinea TaxID=933095 RepID=A0AAI8VHB9_9PEZI|nr:Uu.00g117830.m01.CDS01 [Anthostomella pinea]